ncbi:hypothetical protein GGS21DRAFT_492602 [Xylaria nigripes]|nr:hypothetical protein GGS21DRAFT_492602 [Xylaria nigripes]
MSNYAPSIRTQVRTEAAFSQQSFIESSIRTAPSKQRRRADPEDKINQFLRWKQLPNVHTGLHLAEVAREYGNCTMVFTLLGEDMHKQYKALIYNTNHYNAAATLVNINNRRKTVAFLLAGCFEKQYPRLHATYQTLRMQCPRLTHALDPYLGEIEDGENREDDMDSSYLEISSDPKHQKPRTLLNIPRHVVTARNDLLLSVSTSQDMLENDEFFSMLRRASHEDYGVYMVHPGPSPLQWWQKISFTTSEGDRRTYSVGVFVNVNCIEGELSIARIDGIFSHKRTFSNNAYLCITLATTRFGDNAQDPILGLPYYDVTDRRRIVGLTQISNERLWMVDLVDKGIILVDHNLYFM